MAVVLRFGRAEERELVCRAQAGDRGAADLLARSVEGWVLRQASAHARHDRFRGSADYDDLLSAGWDGVWKALPLFDPGRGTRWITYAGTAARVAIFRAAQQSLLRSARLPRDPDPADPDSLPAGHAPDAPHRLDALWALLDGLDPTSRFVVESRYGVGRKPARAFEVARAIGVSTARVGEILGAALETLRSAAAVQSGEGW